MAVHDQPPDSPQPAPSASGPAGALNAASLAQAAADAVAAFQRGDWSEAELRCRDIIGIQPENYSALSMLGIVAAQTRRAFEAAELFSRAAFVCPERAEAHGNLGHVLHGLKRFEEALASY